MSPLFGATVSHKFTDKLGAGVGIHTIGGSSVKYENVVITGTASSELETKLSLIEVTPAVGYEILDGLRVGVGYRATLASGALTSASAVTLPTNGALGALSGATIMGKVAISDLTKTDTSGLRIGVQYAPKDAKWGLGAVYRNAVSMTLSGNATKTFATQAGTDITSTMTTIGNALGASGTSLIGFTTGTGTLAATLPQSLNLGGYYDLSADLRTSLEYSYTQYSVMTGLAIATTPNGSTTTTTTTQTLNWADQSQVRVGAQYGMNPDWTLRGGYVYTSQVTNSANPSPTLIPPGIGHSFILGAGTKLMDKKLGVDVAAEYASTSGTATGATVANTATAFTGYLGVSYSL